MSDLERRVQDYVDGRLSPAERREFERLLETDPGVARRCADYLEIRAALREDLDAGAALPPGFHTRARAAFEARNAGGARRLPWEALGLAAAAVIAAVVFLPPLLRQDERLMAPAAGRSAAARPDESEESAPPLPPATPAPTGDFAPLPTEKKKRAVIEEPVAGVDADRIDRAGEAPAEAAAPADDLAAAEEEESGPPAMEDAAPPAPRRAAVRKSDDRAAERRRSVAEPLAKQAAALDRAPLPEGTIAADEVALIATDAEWDRRLRAPGGDALAALRGERRDVRAVLIGAGPAGLSCESSRVSLFDGGWAVTPARGGSDTGCAFLVPDDGRPVTVDDR